MTDKDISSKQDMSKQGDHRTTDETTGYSTVDQQAEELLQSADQELESKPTLERETQHPITLQAIYLKDFSPYYVK